MASHPKKITSSYQIAFVIFFIGLMPNLMAINLHIKAMRGTPEIRRTFLSFADNQLVKIKAEKGIKSKGKNIILVPPYHSVVNHFISLRKKIGFVFHWPLPDPNFTQDTIYGLKAKADIDNLRNEFPNRYIFELQLVHENPGMKIILVSQPG